MGPPDAPAGRAAAGIGLLLLVALAGCAQAPASPTGREFYAVLPEPGGKSGALQVTRDGKEYLLEGPYAALSSQSTAPFKAVPDEVNTQFAPAIAAIPPRPAEVLLYFPEGRDDLTADSQRALRELVQSLASRPAPEITLVGHADTTGSHTENDALAQRRAERVRRELLRAGVPARTITVAARGKRDPLVPTPDQTREPRNRRVQVEIR